MGYGLAATGASWIIYALLGGGAILTGAVAKLWNRR